MSSVNVTNIEEVLRSLSADGTGLNAEEIRSLEEQGYAVFPALLTDSELNAIQNRFELIMAQQGYEIGRVKAEGEGNIADIIYQQFNSGQHIASESINEVKNVVNEGEMFDALYSHPKLLAAVHQLTKREFVLSQLTAREVLPGGGVPKLQVGSEVSLIPGEFAVNCIWILDDYDETNGSLSVVPGSHKRNTSPSDKVDQESLEQINAPAGSLIVLDARLWRKEPVNESEKNKRHIYANLIGRNQKQALVQKDYIRMTTYNRLSEASRYILDVLD